MRSAVVGQKVASVDEERRCFAQLLFERLYITDTPCQSADSAAFSAAGTEIAVRVTGEMQRQDRPIVTSHSLGGRAAARDQVRISGLAAGEQEAEAEH
jgi:hypothetical protein